MGCKRQGIALNFRAAILGGSSAVSQIVEYAKRVEFTIDKMEEEEEREKLFTISSRE